MMEVSPFIYAHQCALLVKFVSQVEAQANGGAAVPRENVDAAKSVVMDMIAAVVAYEAAYQAAKG